MMPLQCATCEHFIIPEPRDTKIICKAFPDGIPQEILSGEIDHDQKMRRQIGDFIWKKRKEIKK